MRKEGRVGKFFHCLYEYKNLAFENLKGSNVRNFLGFRKLYIFKMSVDHLNHGALTYLGKNHLFYFGIKLVKASHNIDSDKA